MTKKGLRAGLAGIWIFGGVLLTDATEPLPVPATNAPAQVAAAQAKEAVAGANPGPKDKSLLMDFRNAPLENVLRYLSDAAGFIIDRQGPVNGRVTIMARQPVSQNEALQLVFSALDTAGYAAVRDGQTLRVYSKTDARRKNLPVKIGSAPDRIPTSAEMVTQILPLHYISATQVARDLQPLLPENASVTANEGGNALVITDVQSNIRRIAEILQVLDTAVSRVSVVKVYPLKHADAKTLAQTFKDLFPAPDTGRSGGQGQNRTINSFRGGGPGGSGMDMGGPGGMDFGTAGQDSFGGQSSGNAASSGGKAAYVPIVSVAEERANALIVSAPAEQVAIIDGIVKDLDVDVQELTELRVFHLKNADGQETADLLNNLFGDTSSSRDQGGTGPFFGSDDDSGQGGRGFRGGGSGQGSFARGGSRVSADASYREQRQNKVVATADGRTGAVVVSAGREIMAQIARIVADLDADAARKPRVYVFDVPNSDPASVQQVLQGLFPSLSGAPTVAQNSSQQNTAGRALNNRATQNQNQSTGTSARTSSFGNLGSGSGGSGR